MLEQVSNEHNSIDIYNLIVHSYIINELEIDLISAYNFDIISNSFIMNIIHLNFH
jgi:hypothetical protein